MAKQEQFTFRVTPEERARLEAEALALDRPLSWLIRQKLFNADNPISLTEVRPTSSDNLLGAPWPSASASTTNVHVGLHPAERPPAEKLDMRNDAQKRQAARDQLLPKASPRKK